MIITLEELKGVLGIAADDATHDAELNNAIVLTNALVSSYVGFDLSDTTKVREYTYTPEIEWRYSQNVRRNFVHLPVWPLIEVQEIIDQNGVPIAPSTYRVVRDKGRVDFPGGLPYAELLTFHYRAGFDPVPADIFPASSNIASSIYNNGGQLGTSNALKSLTMFDAMSMSFDTASGATNPASLVMAWSFVLDQYAVKKNTPVLK